MSKKFSPAGFTLIELVVTVAVMAVVVTIVLVAVNPVQRIAQAQNSNTIATAKQIDGAIKQFYTLQSRYPNLSCGDSWCSQAVEAEIFRSQIVGAGILKEIPSYPTLDFAGCLLTYSEKNALSYQLSFCLKNFDPRQGAAFNACILESPGLYLCQDADDRYFCWYYEDVNLSRCLVGEDAPNFLWDFFPYP